MVERLVTFPRGLDEDREVFPRLRLPYEFGQQLRAQRSVADIVAAALGRDDLFVCVEDGRIAASAIINKT